MRKRSILLAILLVAAADVLQRGGHVAGALADREHVGHHPREHPARRERTRDRGAVGDAAAGGGECVADDRVAARLLADLQRLEHVDAVRKQRLERVGER